MRLRAVPGSLLPRPDVAATFLRWTFLRAMLHRGYVLASGLYFVVHDRLSGSQLLVLGAVFAITLTASDIPAGVWSDAFSRKWPLVIGHGFLAAGMVMTGLVTAFGLIVVSQVFWGLGWAFSGGADVAWLADELSAPGRIDRVLTARGRWDLTGGAAGMITFGALGWAAGLAVAIIMSGTAMAVLGLFVAARFTEDNFTPSREQRWSASLSIFWGGLALARRDREILVMLTATLIINGAGVITWLFPRQLVDLGFPDDPVLWYTALGILSFAAGAVALRIVEGRIDGAGAARRTYTLSCLVGTAGLAVLAFAPDALIGSIGVLLVSGIAFNVTRTVSVVWVNRRTTSVIRATVHSFLSQAESIGEVLGGLSLASLARADRIPVVLMTSGALIVTVGGMVAWPRRVRPASPGQQAAGGLCQ